MTIVASLLGLWLVAGDADARPWSFAPIVRPPVPAVRDTTWPRGAIDRFVLAKLEAQGLAPSVEADPERLVRRVTFGLTGLPPTIAEVDAFLRDDPAGRYERLVERLLASPRYGERLASVWLDLARYADTHGYHIDSHRDMWRWRDWVIDAFNANQPFDEFTIQQLAGDLLPNATLDQRLATGFHRNHMINFEDGAIPEEYLAEYVADRVATTATVWLGQTLHCARCHDHSYDPFPQRDFYRLAAFFHNVPELGLDGARGNAAPFLATPTPLQARKLATLQREADDVAAALARRAGAVAEVQAAWEAAFRARHGRVSVPRAKLQLSLDEPDERPVRDATGQVAGTIDGELNRVASGRHGGGLLLDGSTHVTVPREIADRVLTATWTLSLWLLPTTTLDGMLVGAHDAATSRRIVLGAREGRPFLAVQERGLRPRVLAIRARLPLALHRWQHLAAAYDGSGRTTGLQLFVEGRAIETSTLSLPSLPQDSGALVIGRDFRGALDELRFDGAVLTPAQVAVVADAPPILDLVLAGQRTAAESESVRRHFLERHDAEYQAGLARQASLRRQRDELQKRVPTTMVMAELPTPRDTFVLNRGDYRSPLERVTPGTPTALPPMRPEWPRNRLGLARWLVAPENPLPARVFVNQLWQMQFGAGLVRTAEDFGSRGERPSHPELLDWLAAEFVASGWDVKHVQRLIVTSATYRQSSVRTPDAARRDPDNRLLARGPRFRLPGESIRDSALFAAGLLHEELHGPGVMPYQPRGLWREISYDPTEYTAQVYVPGRGAELYRRTLYTFWKRACPPPGLTAFEAPDRETCTPRRPRSNTPLQALVLLNDPTYVEAARALAARALLAANGDDERLTFLFRTVLARSPTAMERADLQALLAEQRSELARHTTDVPRWLLVGESRVDARLGPMEVAAWAVVSGVLLNLDETLTP